MVRENVVIPTRFRDPEALIAQLTDEEVGGEHVLMGGKRIHGLYDEKEETFYIESYSQNGRMYQFVGKMIKEGDYLVLHGEILMKKVTQVVLVLFHIAFGIFGARMAITQDLGRGLIVLLVTLISASIFQRMRPLYKEIKREVGQK